MDGSILEYDSEFSALGAGKLGEYDNELIEAPEDEEDNDLRNDETFGFSDDVGYDWEEDDNNPLIVGFPLSGKPGHGSERSTGKLSPKSFSDDNFEEVFRTQGEYLEESIYNLVVDDDDYDVDDDDDLDIADRRLHGVSVSHTSSHAKDVPKKPVNLNELFGPSSPPGLLETEHLVSPTSRSIWRSPPMEILPTRNIAPKPNQPNPPDNLQSLFNMAKCTGQTSLQQAPKKVLESSRSISRPHTLAEVEKKLFSSVLTAEELERHMRGDTSLSGSQVLAHVSPFSISAPIPPVGSAPASLPSQGFNKPQEPQQKISSSLKSLQNIGSINGRASPSLPPGLISSQHLLQNGGPPAQLLQGMQGRLTNGHGPSPIPAGIRLGLSRNPTPTGHSAATQATIDAINKARLSSPYPRSSIVGNLASNPMLQRPVPRFPANLQCPPNSLRLVGPPNTHNINGQRIPHPGENVRFHRAPPHSVRQFNNQNRNHFHQRGRDYNRDRPEKTQPIDEYAGIMTQKEKDWVIKIQLLQLHTDNPYVDDYYYVRYTLKKTTEERKKNKENDKDEPKLIIPALAKIETKAYTPAHFEGSLGRVSTSSVHNPRQVIDLVSMAHSDDQVGKSSGRDVYRYRQMLMEIEKAYVLLLDIDDIEKRVLALPDESRKRLYEEQNEKLNFLFQSLGTQDNRADSFLYLMSIRKGRKLVARCLPIFNMDQSGEVLTTIIKNLSHLVKRDQLEEGLTVLCESVSQRIGTCDFKSLVEFSQLLLRDTQPNISKKSLVLALQNKLGSSVISSLLNRGEVLYKKTFPIDLDNQLHSTWCQFAQIIADTLDSMATTTIAKPYFQHPNMAVHFDRLLHKKQVASLEDKLRVFTDSLCSIRNS
ncbi:PATL1 [Acanthosepion pharaonis]|uniref:PATL1 n=1 Tax=Acanthosepion pharaonis TaxID=158019 RepID=A0A812APF4_ACAPH|nr:PATL1 [Sepia pharaonis]